MNGHDIARGMYRHKCVQTRCAGGETSGVGRGAMLSISRIVREQDDISVIWEAMLCQKK